jgi:hypothetical protein
VGKTNTNKIARAIKSGRCGVCKAVSLQLNGGRGDLAESLLSIWRRQRIPVYNSMGDCVAEVRFFRGGEPKGAKDSASRGIGKAFVSMVEG